MDEDQNFFIINICLSKSIPLLPFLKGELAERQLLFINFRHGINSGFLNQLVKFVTYGKTRVN